MKYRPDNRSQIVVCDLVKIVCDLTILYQMPEAPQETFLPHTTPMGLTKNPWKCGKKISGLPAFCGGLIAGCSHTLL